MPKFKNTYAILLRECGLSQADAAEIHNVRQDTVANWVKGRRTPPDFACKELLDLDCKLEVAANAAVDKIRETIEERGLDGIVELGISVDDYEAKTLGFQSVGVHAAMLGRVITACHEFGVFIEIVPRGSEVASAAAAELHSK